MKKLTALLVTTAVLSGCTATPIALVDLPEETVKATSQGESVDATIVEEAVEEEQKSTESGTVLPTPEPTVSSRGNAKSEESEVVDAPIVEEFPLSREIVEDNICKLKEVSTFRRSTPAALASSFPAASGMSLPRTGTINVKVVYIEWDDLSGTKEDYDYNLWSAKMFSEFYRVMSEGKLNLKITAEPEWISVGESWKADVIPEGMEGGSWQSKQYLQPFIDRIVSSVDPAVDFTGVDVILFGTPSANIVVDSLHVFGNSGVVARTNEGAIVDMFSLGRRIYEHRESLPGWVQYSHEIGHSLGMPDLRDWSKADKNTKYIVNPMFGHEIMDNQDAGSRSISGWMKWVQGWLDDSQVNCIEASSINKEYYKLNSANAIAVSNELLVIKVSDTRLIAVESTRWDSRFDLRTTTKANGVIVYTVDANLGHQEGPLKLISPRDITRYLSDDHVWPDWRVLDVVMLPGDSVIVENITIKVEKSLIDTDVISISR